MKKAQILLFIIVPILSWYGMMVLHEVGHVFGVFITGAKLETVEIPLVGFSRTDFSGGSSPFLVVIAGPLLGVLIPLLLLLVIKKLSKRFRDVLLFFVGFCLAANGAYIGVDAFILGGDSRQLVQFGSPVLVLVPLGTVCFACGLYLWHRIGSFKKWFSSDEITGQSK